MAAEVAEQPRSLARLLAHRGEIDRIASQIGRARPRFVVFAARGTSDHAALYGKYLVEVRLGLAAGLASMSTATAYRAEPDLRDVLWVAISQSGASPDLVESTQRARRRGALTLAVTNTAGSALAAAAELQLDVRAGAERAVAATKSYTGELLALLLLTDAWTGRPTRRVEALPDQAAAVLADGVPDAVTDRCASAARLVTVGRGYSYPTAMEAALKLTETTGVGVHAFSAADLLHGPVAMVSAGDPVIAVLGEGLGRRAMAPVLAALRERRAEVLEVRSGGRPGAGVLRLPEAVAEAASPVLQILPLQRLALDVALRRGLDPDRPPGLSKITRTR
jgi:glucosamine--fructose-6-phosphate aminotransferase (isomerizing)